jgi:hypothetical protein
MHDYMTLDPAPRFVKSDLGSLVLTGTYNGYVDVEIATGYGDRAVVSLLPATVLDLIVNLAAAYDAVS